MQVFTENDLPSKKPQAMQISHSGTLYDILPMHISIDAMHHRKSSVRAVEHSHDVYHVVLYGESDGKFSLGGKILKAEKGLLVVSSPGEGHLFPPLGKGSVSYSEFTFSYSSPKGRHLDISFAELLSLHLGLEIPKSSNVVKLEFDQYMELHSMLERIAELKESSSELRFLKFYRNISELFNFLALAYAPNVLTPDDSLSSGLIRVRDHIHSNYGSNLKIEKLAKIACVSKGHFQREFRHKFGLSPVSYINGYRISAAKNLLRTTPLLCAEIAEKTGFEDIFYFSKVFRNLAGISPARYRNDKGNL